MTSEHSEKYYNNTTILMDKHMGGHSVSQTQFLEFTLFSEHIFLNHIYSSHAISNFYRLLITFANSLDLNQDRPKVDPDLGPNCLTL